MEKFKQFHTILLDEIEGKLCEFSSKKKKLKTFNQSSTSSEGFFKIFE